MLIKSEFDVAESPDRVWEFFNEIPLVAACLPGADISNQVSEDEYEGTVVIGLGPVTLNFAGSATVKDRDEANRTITVDASGADVKGRGQAALHLVAALAPAGAGTKVRVDQDLQLSGAAAQYGRGLVQDVTAVLLDEFASNMRGQLEALEKGVAYTPTEGASASGVAIGLRAVWMGLVRVFKRFFMPYEPATDY
jgi:carbon monoxide dehydrogenase subunit G